jgi:hypothetical protein
MNEAHTMSGHVIPPGSAGTKRPDQHALPDLNRSVW